MKILVIDDDECQLQWCAKQLEKHGFQVETAVSGEKGLDLYKRGGPWHFVLTDYLFIPTQKVRDGLELIRQIHAINPDQRLAMHTGERGLKAPVPVLTKPYPIGRLLRLLREQLRSLALCPER